MEKKQLLNEVVNGNYLPLTNEIAFKCLNIVTKLYPIYENPVKSAEDVFLMCSALNYLNAYVKVDIKQAQKTFKEFYNNNPEIEEYVVNFAKKYNSSSKYIPYTKCRDMKDIYKCFKKLVKVLIEQIIHEQELKDDIKISIQIDKNMTLALIEVFNVQFSFHQIKIYPEDKELNNLLNDKSTWIHWHGVRLQPIATHVFDLAQKQESLSEINKSALKGLKIPVINYNSVQSI